jgi:rhomboid protease GluP
MAAVSFGTLGASPPVQCNRIRYNGSGKVTCRDAKTSPQRRIPTALSLYASRVRDIVAHVEPTVSRPLPDPDAEAHDFALKLRSLGPRPNPWTSVTNVIIALNVAVFIVMGSLGAGWLQTESIMPYVLYGANNGAATTDGEWWRLVTSMFMHYGLLHLALNMWALYQTGHFMERVLGRASFALMYLASGIVSGFASIFWHGDQSWSAGASGAVFGVYGAILGFMLRERQGLPKHVVQSLTRSTLMFAGYNIFFGLSIKGIDNSAHLGGFVGGIVFGFLLALPLDPVVRARARATSLVIAVTALAVLTGLGIAFTPRFDYRVSDLLLWQQTVEEFSQHEESRLGPFPSPDDPVAQTAYAVQLEAGPIPSDTEWIRRFKALSLTPGQATARTRDLLVQALELRTQSHQRLAAGLRAHDPQAITRFEADRVEVVAAIARFKAAAKN